MFKRCLCTLTLAVVLFGLLAGTALATTNTISGSLYRNGSLVQFQTKRYHPIGRISFYITDNTANYTRLGVRNTAGSQITDTLQFDGVKYSQTFLRSSNHSSTIPTQYFFLNGRMGSTWFLGNNTFAGQLTF